MKLPAPPIKGQRVEHPDWCGRARVGTVVRVVNRWHAVVEFDYFPRAVTVAVASLEPHGEVFDVL